MGHFLLQISYFEWWEESQSQPLSRTSIPWGKKASICEGPMNSMIMRGRIFKYYAYVREIQGEESEEPRGREVTQVEIESFLFH